MARKRIVHIGTGPWGRNYLETLTEFPVTVTVADRDTWRACIDEKPDGVIVCTPPDTHIELATYALERDIPVMIEKPLALSREDAVALRDYTAPILVDHLYLFSAGYQALKQALEEKEITGIETVGTGTKSHEGYSPLWDYGPHDISMILDLMGRVPDRVRATEISPARSYEVEMGFGDVVTRSRFGVGEERERRIEAQHSEGTESFEDLGQDVPKPLHAALQVFLSAIDGKHDGRLGLTLSLDVLRVLEASERSLASAGAVDLSELP